MVAKSKAALAQRPTVQQMAPAPPRLPPPPGSDLDRLLDKIGQHGIDSLTSDERRLLDEASKRMRGEGTA